MFLLVKTILKFSQRIYLVYLLLDKLNFVLILFLVLILSLKLHIVLHPLRCKNLPVNYRNFLIKGSFALVLLHGEPLSCSLKRRMVLLECVLTTVNSTNSPSRMVIHCLGLTISSINFKEQPTSRRLISVLVIISLSPR